MNSVNTFQTVSEPATAPRLFIPLLPPFPLLPFFFFSSSSQAEAYYKSTSAEFVLVAIIGLSFLNVLL